MQYLAVVLVAAAAFGLCYLVDKGFAKLFRNKAQHMSGMAVRANKRYGAFGAILIALGTAALFAGLNGEWIMIAAGALIIVIGVCMVVYYLSFGIFYDDDGFVISRVGRKSRLYRFCDIRTQQLYIASGNTVIELHMADGEDISLQAGMTGVYPFLDHAFANWCRQKRVDPAACTFHNSAESCWFPTEEEA